MKAKEKLDEAKKKEKASRGERNQKLRDRLVRFTACVVYYCVLLIGVVTYVMVSCCTVLPVILANLAKTVGIGYNSLELDMWVLWFLPALFLVLCYYAMSRTLMRKTIGILRRVRDNAVKKFTSQKEDESL